MRKWTRRSIPFAFGLLCLFVPAGMLWGLLLYQTDGSREALLQDLAVLESPSARKTHPNVMETSVPGPQMAARPPKAEDPTPQPVTPSLLALLQKAEAILHDPKGTFAQKNHGSWMGTEVTEERAPAMLEKTGDWAGRMDAALRDLETQRMWEADTEFASSAVALLLVRLRAHALLSDSVAHSVDFMTLGRFYAIFHTSTYVYFPTYFVEDFNREYVWQCKQSPLGEEDLEELVRAFRSNSHWTPADRMRESRRYFALRFKTWAELSPLEAFQQYGPINGIGTYIWKTPLCRPMFNLDVETFMAKSDELIALAESPWCEAKDDIQELYEWCESRPINYTATLNWFPHVIYDLRWHVGAEAAAEVIRLGLLLELHMRRHGHPPTSLNELLPMAEDVQLVDPFSGQPFTYTLTENAFAVEGAPGTFADWPDMKSVWRVEW